jgi:hypothetical protein
MRCQEKKQQEEEQLEEQQQLEKQLEEDENKSNSVNFFGAFVHHFFSFYFLTFNYLL